MDVTRSSEYVTRSSADVTKSSADVIFKIRKLHEDSRNSMGMHNDGGLTISTVTGHYKCIKSNVHHPKRTVPCY